MYLPEREIPLALVNTVYKVYNLYIVMRELGEQTGIYHAKETECRIEQNRSKI